MCRRTHAAYARAELAIGTHPLGRAGISRPIEIRGPSPLPRPPSPLPAPVSTCIGGIGYSAASNGKPIDYPAARFYHTPSICKLIHYNCSVKVAHVR